MGMNIQTIKDIRQYLSSQLQGIYPVSEISALTNIIIKTVTGTSKLHHLAMPESQVSEDQAERIINFCKELEGGRPIQYILGETDFYNCTIKLNATTLIPRPETEELVDLIINENKGFRGKILDVGTGSGCIAIALAANLKGAEVTGFDISGGAINVARENSIINSVNITLITADLFSLDHSHFLNTDIIVSNPPYVREVEKQFINDNVLKFEPHEALFVPDSDPLKYYRAVLDLSVKILAPGGKVYFEINEALGKEMYNLLKSYTFSNVLIVNDLNGRSRIAKGIKDA
jgi:release factor glutamine methyltransferase